MKGTLNPFEPWRPVEARIPPRLHASHPWRPPPPPPVLAAVEEPPLVEPVNAPPQKKPRKRSQAEGARTSVLNRPMSPLYAMYVSFLVFLSMLAIAWVVLGIASLGFFQAAHMTRLCAVGFCAVMLAGFALSKRYGWHTRLAGMVLALALAGISLWFVPTTQGVNLWSAYRQFEELRTLPAGDVAAYRRGVAARWKVVEEFPSVGWEVKVAERAWFRRTVDEAIENADRRLDKDPDAVLAHLHQLDNELKALSQPVHYDLVWKDLESARRRALQASLQVAQQR